MEHQFEVVVDDIRGLSVFGSTVWGETDCFVQYHFPRQRPSGADDEDDDDGTSYSQKPFTTYIHRRKTAKIDKSKHEENTKQ